MNLGQSPRPEYIIIISLHEFQGRLGKQGPGETRARGRPVETLFPRLEYIIISGLIFSLCVHGHVYECLAALELYGRTCELFNVAAGKCEVNFNLFIYRFYITLYSAG